MTTNIKLDNSITHISSFRKKDTSIGYETNGSNLSPPQSERTAFRGRRVQFPFIPLFTFVAVVGLSGCDPKPCQEERTAEEAGITQGVMGTFSDSYIGTTCLGNENGVAIKISPGGVFDPDTAEDIPLSDGLFAAQLEVGTWTIQGDYMSDEDPDASSEYEACQTFSLSDEEVLRVQFSTDDSRAVTLSIPRDETLVSGACSSSFEADELNELDGDCDGDGVAECDTAVGRCCLDECISEEEICSE